LLILVLTAMQLDADRFKKQRKSKYKSITVIDRASKRCENQNTMARSKTRSKRGGKYPRLIQTHVDDDLFERIVKQADAEQIPAAAYVRRLLYNHVPGGK
jgi:hypothetical protein